MTGGRFVRLNPFVANNARVFDYVTGGKDNYDADREAADWLMSAHPQLPRDFTKAQEFTRRAVRWLGRTGIDQFADLGTGIPRQPYLHEYAPGSRWAYVDNDLVVAAHAQALLQLGDGSQVVLADFTEADRLFEKLGHVLDLARPIGVVLGSVLDFLAKPAQLVEALTDRLTPGSHLVISHAASDIWPERSDALERTFNERARMELFPRSSEELRSLLAGWTVVAPGIMGVDRWQAPDMEPGDGRDIASEPLDPVIYHGVTARL
ncbi:SAM-dependent methyltransferase [Nocardia tengchongensis]|uniref:SAM-dependent methyltransferase n=1 Tax=Nocardia tengchongensis TaxID=2055889 RepID=UPI00368650FE